MNLPRPRRPYTGKRRAGPGVGAAGTRYGDLAQPELATAFDSTPSSAELDSRHDPRYSNERFDDNYHEPDYREYRARGREVTDFDAFIEMPMTQSQTSSFIEQMPMTQSQTSQHY